MLRFLRFFVGLLLIPLCVAAGWTLVTVMKSLQPGSAAAVPLSGWSIMGGFVLWLVVYFTLPRPVRTYVLGHELTHALWGLLMGARVSKLRVSRDSGSVTLSKNNFLITLSPYFFPFYTVLLITIYWLLKLFLAMDGYYLYWLGMVGFTWGLHITFTASTLCQRQTDIQECGYLFSYALIAFFNIAGVVVWVAAVSEATFRDAGICFRDHCEVICGYLWGGLQWGFSFFRQ